MARQDIWLFCDEMYRGLEYSPADRLPSASTRYERAVSLWGMSKTFGLAGLRLGWLVVQDRELLQALLKFKDYTTICNSAPSEFLAHAALAQADSIIVRNLEIIQTNLGHVHQFMASQPDRFTEHVAERSIELQWMDFLSQPFEQRYGNYEARFPVDDPAKQGQYEKTVKDILSLADRLQMPVRDVEANYPEIKAQENVFGTLEPGKNEFFGRKLLRGFLESVMGGPVNLDATGPQTWTPATRATVSFWPTKRARSASRDKEGREAIRASYWAWMWERACADDRNIYLEEDACV